MLTIITLTYIVIQLKWANEEKFFFFVLFCFGFNFSFFLNPGDWEGDI